MNVYYTFNVDHSVTDLHQISLELDQGRVCSPPLGSVTAQFVWKLG